MQKIVIGGLNSKAPLDKTSKMRYVENKKPAQTLVKGALMQDKAIQSLINLCNNVASELDTSSMDLYLATHEGHTAKEIRKILTYNIEYLEEVARQVKKQVAEMS